VEPEAADFQTTQLNPKEVLAMASIDDPYEGLDVGDRFQPETPDAVEVTLTEIKREESTQFTKPGEPPNQGVILLGVTADGKTVEWAAWSVAAKRAAVKAGARVGDTVRISFDGFGTSSKPGFNPPKLWTVEVLCRDGEVELDSLGFPKGF
jgi:hypothetical protein